MPRGPSDPAGSIFKGQKGKTLSDKGNTDNATNLALSDPSAAPVTTDEPCSLGRKRTRGLFKREDERERARNEMIDELPEVEERPEERSKNANV